jgi:hypothetical protein
LGLLIREAWPHTDFQLRGFCCNIGECLTSPAAVTRSATTAGISITAA